MHYFIGMDVGGTKSEICVLKLSDLKDFESFEVLARDRFPTEKNSTFESYLDKLSLQIQSVLNKSNLNIDQIQGVGIGLPGSIDPETQIMSQGNVSFFKGQNLPQSFAKALNFKGPILFDNDANCFALAEAYLGAGKR